ncbi:MAG: LegC family aminotransferase [Saprospiraceae bacterium]|nr:LegC family aminotransferase [Saprospiraceae bacterium]
MQTNKSVISFIRNLYNTEDFIPLHEPCFIGNEKKYLNECIDTTFVSSVGKFVDLFEKKISEYTGAKHAVVTVNGTEALHISLLLSNIGRNDEIITQPLTFIATANAISYMGAHPVFIDVDRETLGLSPQKLENFLSENTEIRNNFCFNKISKRYIKACVPVHTFGHPIRIDEIKIICEKYKLILIEDAAESLGSLYKGKHTGTFGKLGILSFNGNKIITTGGGGMILTDDEELAKQAKHITTQAKVPHKWEYIHDKTAYNYRMPNINAALGVAQLDNLDNFIKNKRELADIYKNFFKKTEIEFFTEPKNAFSNYWLNVIILKGKTERDKFLEYTNSNRVMTRPVWRLMNKLEMYKYCQAGNLENSEWLEDRIVNIPSSFRTI